ncbi:MAG: phosphoribosylglycinamide formyltransferase [Nevskia sp.]|nr:phosphoribosylglycinamide formyltransferase [Nevskia sp.]
MGARLVILISGRGRNLRALTEAVRDRRIDAELVCVISNRADAEGLAYARAAGIATEVVAHIDFTERSAFDAALAARLRTYAPDIVALAGFMRVLGDDFVREFAGRMLNIHPSLLPKYAGLQTHRRALAAGDAEHGATVHFVTPEVDGGAQVIQGRLTLQPDDDEARLAERVMGEIELKIYPQAVAWMARGDLRLVDGAAVYKSRRLDQALTMAQLEEAFR